MLYGTIRVLNGVVVSVSIWGIQQMDDRVSQTDDAASTDVLPISRSSPASAKNGHTETEAKDEPNAFKAAFNALPDLPEPSRCTSTSWCHYQAGFFRDAGD